ncbi:uncharacterized protein TRAVEDRAFT_48939 [Trametes versicolor FP-101664 SS1]|uniref:uncharacterized protein n=1 Tax=Trametes versicolor (strain FP-101664) TaxID=717944 RepID=UPI00046249B2|nr:uncharacterized protein TRAVEDRAFT_48939 [Trametes versicolor FP-101664 SS1]EIW57916.1 hypothetical protein TRAVEDRAFT_48939 [Trametes versicolor FP-101664 SS1]
MTQIPAGSESIPALPKVPPLDNTVGVVLLCTFLGCMLFGLTIHQTYRYFRLYPTDGWRLKTFVTVLFVLDVFHTVLTIHMCHFYLINNYFNPARLVEGVWSIRMSVMQTGCVIVVSHCFYARRMYLLGGGRLWPIVFIITLLTVEFGLCIAATVEAFVQVTFENYAKYAWVVCSALGTAVVVDVFVSAALIYYLHSSRTGFKRTDSLLDVLMVYAINTGLSTSIVSLAAALTAIIMPRNLVYSGLYIISSKLYANSLLAVLNSRRALVDRDMEGFDTGSFGMRVVDARDLNPIDFKTPSNPRVPPAQTVIDVRVTKEIYVDGVPVPPGSPDWGSVLDISEGRIGESTSALSVEAP